MQGSALKWQIELIKKPVSEWVFAMWAWAVILLLINWADWALGGL